MHALTAAIIIKNAKKEINASKTYSTFDRHAERAKLCIRYWQPAHCEAAGNKATWAFGSKTKT